MGGFKDLFYSPLGEDFVDKRPHIACMPAVFRLALVGRNTEALARVRAECEGAGAAEVVVMARDLAEEEQCRAAVTQTIEHYK